MPADKIVAELENTGSFFKAFQKSPVFSVFSISAYGFLSNTQFLKIVCKIHGF
jgi:hypothetical protein